MRNSTFGLRVDLEICACSTPGNDAAESLALAVLFGDVATPCSSTKGATGHTLGAAGALEAVISALALQQGLMPAGVNTEHVDLALGVHYLLDNRGHRANNELSNSFGVAGTNCSLVFARAL